MFYECKYCGKLYKQEQAFSKHKCKEMERHFTHGTIEGQIAFMLFERWMILRHGRKPDLGLFHMSRYYGPILKFAKYYKNIKGFADIDDFLKLMIKLDILPNSWYDQKVLSYYFTELDNKKPIEQIKTGIGTFIKLSDAYGCNIEDVFIDLEFDVLVSMLGMHKLTPWVLLNSKKFIKWMTDLPWEQQYLMDNIIDCDRWKNKFKEDSKSLEFAKLCIREIGL
jgi:hypothetical protein